MNSLYGTPLTGMQGADFELNVVANNIANVNTSGYEVVEPIVASLPNQPEVGDPNNGIAVSPRTHVGMGVEPSATVRSQAQAPLQATGNPLDLAIDGPGFFALRQGDGQRVYARQVSLHLQPNGELVTAQGLALVPPVRVPAGVIGVTATNGGKIVGETRTGASTTLGTLSVVSFAAPENLREREGVYSETLGSGRPQTGGPGATGTQRSTVLSGYQLGLTVDLATEMTSLIEAQRMYQANSKALQTLDSLVNNVVSIQQR